ncbi:acetyl-CoA synthetase-like protein [Rostrohypoxylon terebratum]|nr:acetyl-CoA synthetase-like protein [Rostrohypoxylon terebratum]
MNRGDSTSMASCATLQDVLRRQAESSCQRRLLFYPLGNTTHAIEVTYGDLYHQAKHNSFRVLSLEEFKVGQPLLLHFDDHWDNILWFWSVLLAGGVPVISTPFSNVEEDRSQHIKALSGLLQAPVCFTRSRLLPLFDKDQYFRLKTVETLLGEARAGSAQCERPHCNVCGGDSVNAVLDGVQDVDSDVCGSNSEEAIARRKDSTMMLLLTSGSTGNAKAVKFTHSQVLAAVAGKAALRPNPPDQPFLNWIGLDHVAGLIEIHLQALWLGVDQVHASAADVVPSPRIFLDLLSRHRVSRTFAPNFFLARLVSTIDVSEAAEREWNLSGLLGVVSGGEANDVKTCLAASTMFQNLGATTEVLIAGFGMTETCAGSIYNGQCPSYDIAQGNVIASLGKCISGAEMRIASPESITGLAGLDEVGGLEVRGSVVFGGYYRNQNATDESFTTDRWFRTGDRGFIDGNGNLNLVGRSKDVININGVKIATGDIQEAIEQALGDQVGRLVVFASKTAHTERVTVAYVPAMFPISDETAAAIARLATRACLLRTGTCPLIFPLLEQSLPKLSISTLGKISRVKAAVLFANGEFDRDIEFHEHSMRRAAKNSRKCDMKWATQAETQLIEDVAETLNTNAGMLDIHADTCVFDIGFTSMHVIKLKYRIDRRLGMDFPVVHIIKNLSIRSLAANIDAHVHRSKSLDLEHTPVHSYDSVVVLRTEGTKTPLWLVHPGVGEVLIFVRLAQNLARDNRPVFALRAAGFEPGQQFFSSIQETVDIYTAAIRRRQPHGPYALAGYSYGAMLAFEIAKRLEGDGAVVRFLGSFNLPPHIKTRIRQLDWSTCLLNLAHFLELLPENVSDSLVADGALDRLPHAVATQQVLEMANAPRLKELGLDRKALMRWVDVAYSLQSMAMDYNPSGKVDSIDVFHAIPLKAVSNSREQWLCEHLSRWEDFVREPPRFHGVQGAHYTMISAQYVKSFASTLMKALKARGL